MDFKERRFSIDPGKGRKMDGCPYSIYEDGRDVKDYIIPPKGHIFKGFRFDPDANNQIYDGKLIAEYEKETFNEVIKSNLWKFLLTIGIIIIIAVVAILAANVFKEPKPVKPVEKDPKTEVKVTPTDTVKPSQNAENKAVDTTNDAKTVTPTSLEEKVEAEQPSPEQPQPADDPNAQFKNEFWTLIHTRTIMMDPYHELFVNNKGKANGEEYDYLRFTILENTPSFKEWTGKLRKVPASDLENIKTIDDLKSKLNSINNNN